MKPKTQPAPASGPTAAWDLRGARRNRTIHRVKGIRIKVGWDGAFYVDGGRLAEAGFKTFVDRAREEGAALVVYREGVGMDPSNEQRASIDRLKETGLELLHPVDAPPEWGPLQSFELEVTPSRFRLSAERGKDMLFAYAPQPGEKPLAYVFKGVGDSALQNLDLLISSNRVVESKPHEPDRAFGEETLEKRGMHVRFSYGPRRVWQSFYEADSAPRHLENLYLGCRSLGLHVVKTAADAGELPS